MTLSTILVRKREEVRVGKLARPIGSLGAALSDRDFDQAVRRARPAFLLEVKPRSPSAGPIRSVADLGPVLACYRQRADVVSVLTDATFFGGSLDLLARVRSELPQPVLAKDFIIDPWQVALARAAGADAILLILAAIDDSTYRACAEQARALRMGVLTEVHTAAEMVRAAALGAGVIGINSRNLATFAVDLTTPAALAAAAPPGAVLIAESGLRTRADIRRLAGLVDGFLIGTTLLRQPDPDPLARELIYGATKICGLTSPEDAVMAARSGATHGGLVFAPSSRRIDLPQAERIRRAAPLRWVGVFAGQAPEEVAGTARRLGLDAVQLHGGESDPVLQVLHRLLPEGVEVWRALPVNGAIPAFVGPAARWLLDHGAGGTGTPFDWRVLAGVDRPEATVMSGGLTPDNIATVPEVGIDFFDVSSGVEHSPGRKDADRIGRFMAARRARSARRRS